MLTSLPSLDDLQATINEILGAICLSSTIAYDELTIHVEPESIIQVMTVLRDHPSCLFKSLIDICGVDCIDHSPRFQVVYHLLSPENNTRLRVKVVTDGVTPVPSVIPVFACANWYERETWELFGIPFRDHPNLKRLLTDYEFKGYPLRKDFPLTGYVQVRYDTTQQKVIEEPVVLDQDYRTFDFLSPWEGMLRTPASEETPASATEKKE